jgi:GNAT superfamily N-acetyltransferase
MSIDSVHSPPQTAIPDDAPAIAALLTLVWGNTDLTDHLQRVILLSNHATHVVYADGHLAGFVDGFLTVSAAGVPRWEVDLLAVHPAYRGHGIARRLIHANLQAGVGFGAAYARALIAVGNHASEQAFAHCGFTPLPDVHHLMIYGTTPATADLTPAPRCSSAEIQAHLHPVQTFTYTGLWIEQPVSEADFAFAKFTAQRFGWGSAGALIPEAQPQLQQYAAKQGYEALGAYRWYQRV